MQNLFDEVATLDKRCYDEFGLSEDLLMEHAADGMADFIRTNFAKDSRVLIVSGSGNNGADGITLARLLHGDYEVDLYLAKEPKSPMARLQLKRIQSICMLPTEEITGEYDIVVDAILGTGFSGSFNPYLRTLLQKLNTLDGFKIACDIPSGIRKDGTCENDTFQADVTLTMGALKKALFLDEAKEFTGTIRVLDLGVTRKIYEKESDWKLLDLEDMRLPHRTRQSTHKGSFGHTAVIAGEKGGAAQLCASSALRFGSGLVSVVDYQNRPLTPSLMQSEHLPQTATAIAAGMGLGAVYSNEDLLRFFDNDLPIVIDADLFYHDILLSLLRKENLVLTPHPKEFSALLRQTGLAEIEVQEVQKRRFELAELFCNAYPNAVLLLKGANPIIAKHKHFFINPHGTNLLSKGGSGDVLAGMIAALLAQRYEPLQAAITASLAHAKLARLYEGNNFSLNPIDLVESISKL